MRHTLLALVSIVSFEMHGMDDSTGPRSPYTTLNEENPYGSNAWDTDLNEKVKDEPQHWRAPRIDAFNEEVVKGDVDTFLFRWSDWKPIIRPSYASSSTFDGTVRYLIVEEEKTAIWKTKTEYHGALSLPPWHIAERPTFKELLDNHGKTIPAHKVSSISSALATNICAAVLKGGTILIWNNERKGGKPSQVLTELSDDAAMAESSELRQMYADDPKGQAAFDEQGRMLVVGDKSGRLYVWERNRKNNFIFKRNSFLEEAVPIESIATDGTHVACASNNKIFLRNAQFATGHSFCSTKDLSEAVKHVMLYKSHVAQSTADSLLACVLTSGKRMGPSRIADFEDPSQEIHGLP